jgi:hypothetical protein
VRSSLSVVYVGGYSWWGPRAAFYDPFWFGYGRYGPYRPYEYYGYPPRPYAGSVRIDVEPREADVYVDGYHAGLVDDFDGVFQRLRLEPGGHDITIFLDGYRTVTESLYVRPGADHRIRFDMERLGPGETSEPPPAPVARARREDEPPRDPRDPRRGRGRIDEPATERPEPAVRHGTVAIRLQPPDAEVVVDGEPWTGPREGDRVSIRLAEGRHRIEVRKAGFRTYSEEILVLPNRILSLAVTLTGGADQTGG